MIFLSVHFASPGKTASPDRSSPRLSFNDVPGIFSGSGCKITGYQVSLHVSDIVDQKRRFVYGAAGEERP